MRSIKKLILIASVLCAMILPTVSTAGPDPFTQLIKKALAPADGVCGQTSDPGFCACFTDAIVAGCKTKPMHPQCTPSIIHGVIDKEYHDDYAHVCQLFPPPGVDPSECATDLRYWHDNCPI